MKECIITLKYIMFIRIKQLPENSYKRYHYLKAVRLFSEQPGVFRIIVLSHNTVNRFRPAIAAAVQLVSKGTQNT